MSKVRTPLFLFTIKPLRHFPQDLVTKHFSTGKKNSQGKWKIMVISKKNVSLGKTLEAKIP